MQKHGSVYQKPEPLEWEFHHPLVEVLHYLTLLLSPKKLELKLHLFPLLIM